MAGVSMSKTVSAAEEDDDRTPELIVRKASELVDGDADEEVGKQLSWSRWWAVVSVSGISADPSSAG